MNWKVKFKDKENKEIQSVIKYCMNWLEKYDTKKLGEVCISGSLAKTKSFWGHCSYPFKLKGIKLYNIKCFVHERIAYPHKRTQRRSPIYFTKNGVEVPGAQEMYENMGRSYNWDLGHIKNVSDDGKTSWIRAYEYVTYNSIDECIASIFGHEIGHFLSKTKQIKYRNTEIEIDKFEDKFLQDYINYRNEQI